MALLEISSVSVHFGGVQALRDVSLGVDDGSIHCIIGPNGAGKSTLVNVMTGRIKPDHGNVTFDGRSLMGMQPFDINQRGIARVFQTPSIFPEMSLIDNVMIAGLAKRDGRFRLNLWQESSGMTEITDRAEEHLAEVGLEGKADLEAQYLSRGDKRRLELAICLASEPRLVLLDEPTAGMSRHETESTIELLKGISKKGVTKVVIEHDMHLVFSLAERLSVLHQGEIIASGSPEEVRGDERVVEAAVEVGRFRVAVAVEAHMRAVAGVDQRGMVEPVLEHGVTAAEQRRADTEVGHVAGGEQQRALAAGERGQFLLECVVRFAVAVDEMGGAAAGAPLAGAVRHGLGQARVGGEAEVVVGAEAEDGVPVDDHFRALGGLGDAAGAVEALGLALVQRRAHALTERFRRRAVPEVGRQHALGDGRDLAQMEARRARVRVIDGLQRLAQSVGMDRVAETAESFGLYDDLRAASPSGTVAQRRIDNVEGLLRSLAKFAKKKPGLDGLADHLERHLDVAGLLALAR